MTKKERDALNLLIESVIKPDHDLRQSAHEQKCYHELMHWRQQVIDYLYSKYD
jgi:hypothetical protein